LNLIAGVIVDFIHNTDKRIQTLLPLKSCLLQQRFLTAIKLSKLAGSIISMENRHGEGGKTQLKTRALCEVRKESILERQDQLQDQLQKVCQRQ